MQSPMRVDDDCLQRPWGAVLIVAILAAWVWPLDSASTPRLSGVVLEAVGAGSALDRAGLAPGDVVLSWHRPPAPPADPHGEQGTLGSVFDWQWLEIEQAPRGPLQLMVERDGVRRQFEVTPGEWAATVRPWLPEPLLQDYESGQQHIDAQELEAGVDLWRLAAARAAAQAAPTHIPCWFHLRSAEAWDQAGRREEAREAYRLALEAAPGPLSRAMILEAMARAAEQAKDFAAAREAFDAALEIRETTEGENLALAQRLLDRGSLAFKQRKIDAAASFSQRALEIAERLAPDSLLLAYILNLRAILASVKGDPHRAGDNFARALRLAQHWEPEGKLVARLLNNLGNAASRRGDQVRAADYHERSLALKRKLGVDDHRIGVSLGNLGNVARRRNDLARAAEFYEASLELNRGLEPDSLSVALDLSSLGGLAMRRGDFDRSAAYFAEALAINRKRAPGSLQESLSLNDLGNLAHKRGDLAQAVVYTEQALAIREQVAPGSLAHAYSLLQLGRLASERGELDRAAEYSGQTLTIIRKLAPGSDTEARTLHQLATIRRQQERPQEALELYRQALHTLENQLDRLGGSRVQAGFRADRAAFYRDAIEVALELNQPEEAFHTLERSRARGFLDQLAERDLVFGEVPDELAQQRRQLAVRYDRTQSQITRLDAVEQAEERAALFDQLRRLRRQSDDIRAEIIRTSPRLGALRYPKPLDFAAARQALDSGTVMLAYSVGQSASHLFVVARDAPLRVHTLPIGEPALRSGVEAILKLQATRSSAPYKEPLMEAGARLYQALIAPAEASVARSDRLLVVPDGPLHLLPFALLVRDAESGEGERDFSYLVEWKPIHAVLSATVYAELGRARREAGAADTPAFTLAAFGDPQYTAGSPEKDLATDRAVDAEVRAAAARGFALRPLPYSRREVTRIAALYPPETARSYLGEEASEERAKEVGPKARILHFATHGRFDDRIPLNSYLALSLPEDFSPERDNGLLQAWEILERVRLDADLVVLSACESGLGEELRGEGLVGLTRAFQFAGARTVVASLWQVNDQATTELMVRFYRHLEAGKSKNQALRDAQLELIRAPIALRNRQGELVKRDLSLPYYWAAFQMIGDWR